MYLTVFCTPGAVDIVLDYIILHMHDILQCNSCFCYLYHTVGWNWICDNEYTRWDAFITAFTQVFLVLASQVIIIIIIKSLIWSNLLTLYELIDFLNFHQMFFLHSLIK